MVTALKSWAGSAAGTAVVDMMLNDSGKGDCLTPMLRRMSVSCRLQWKTKKIIADNIF